MLPSPADDQQRAVDCEPENKQDDRHVAAKVHIILF